MSGQQKKTAGIAITSLVLGILGILTIWLCGLGALFAIPAVICGHIGYARVRRSAGGLAGEHLAVAGLITGYLGIALLVLLIPFYALLTAIAVPSFVKARNQAQDTACHHNLRQMEAAIAQYAADNSNRMPISVSQLVGSNSYLQASPRCPQGGFYTWPSSPSNPPTCSIHGTP